MTREHLMNNREGGYEQSYGEEEVGNYDEVTYDVGIRGESEYQRGVEEHFDKNGMGSDETL